MKTVTEKKTIEKTVHKYISNDGNSYATSLVWHMNCHNYIINYKNLSFLKYTN